MNHAILEAISPWAEIDALAIRGLSPRLETLEGKTIGMLGDFMDLAMHMLHAVEEELVKTYPNTQFSYLQYTAENGRLDQDMAFRPTLDAWLETVDAVMWFYGSVPSSSLYLGYNAAYLEKCGKPCVMLVVPRTYPAGVRGVKALGVPGLRIVQYDIPGDKVGGTATRESVRRNMAPDIERVSAALAAALTDPLTDEEAHPSAPDQSYATKTYTGTAREIQDKFYRLGFTNGQPIEIPTRAAVDEMLRGTDLPADHVVGYIPPKMGIATVEKIAVNAVMAGCLPTYLPILIAAVQGALDPKIILEGWTCSQSTWGPMITVSGPAVRGIDLNTKDNALSPYYKANATLGRAFGYIMMNIAGLRPGIEDLSEMGHEHRLGYCMGDDPDTNPWGPVHLDFGLETEDSAVTMFWPQCHQTQSGNSPAEILDWICTAIRPQGWDPGMAIILSPKAAKMMADAGWTKRRIMEYVVEYARHPASDVPLQWLIGNNHPPRVVDLPLQPQHSTRFFWTSRHMFVTVAGGQAGSMVTVLAGGGDHGGPSCTKIELPKAWNELVEQYNIRPSYIDY